MLKYIMRILSAVVELGTEECQEIAEILVRELRTLSFGALHQELDSIAFLEELAGNTSLANAITKSMKNMGKIYSVAEVEYFGHKSDGLYGYGEGEALYECYWDYVDYLDKKLAFKENNYAYDKVDGHRC